MNEVRIRPFILLGFFKWLSTVYIFGPKRLTIKTGILGLHSEYIEYARMVDISIDESFLERFIGNCGDIKINTVDKTAPKITLHNIIPLNEIHILLRKMIDKNDDNIQRVEFLQ